MAQMKFATLWMALFFIIAFVIQTIFPVFESSLLLNESSIFQPWRFISAIFLHGSITHLLSNLFAFSIFGFILEKTIGTKRFLFVFFITGILANVIAYNFYPTSLGASGAIMGIIGTLTIIRPTMAVFTFGMIIPMFIAAIIWVIIDTIGIFIPDNIGHLAHLSGIFFGIIFGIILRQFHEQRKKNHKIKVPEHILRRWEVIYMSDTKS